jgi:PAT family beta-lactamase induction signal transducer AmpG
MAGLVAVGMLGTLMAHEPAIIEPKETDGNPASWVSRYVITPFTDFMRHDHWLAVLLFIVLYKFCDAFMGVMTNPFLIELGFTKGQIAAVVKLFGLWATIAGSLLGGFMVYRLGILRSLWICGFAHMLTNLMFVFQAWAGPNVYYLAACVTFENVSGGMGTAAFVAYISGLCNRHFTGTQYALLSSFAAFGRTWLSTPAGVVAEHLGWPLFLIFSSLLAVPGLVLLWWLTKRAGLKIA